MGGGSGAVSRDWAGLGRVRGSEVGSEEQVVSRTKQAFDRFRFKYPEKTCPPVEFEDQRREMLARD